MTYDYSKLRGRIVEKYGVMKNFNEAMGLSARTLNLKMNNKVYWKQDDIETAIKLLEIDREDIPVYFFTSSDYKCNLK